MPDSAKLLALLVLVVFGGCAPEDAGEGVVPAGFLRLGTVLGEPGVEGFAVADRPRQFRFPRDHGAHPDYRSEWWYLTFTLEDGTGAPVGVQFTLFRQALAPGRGERDGDGNRWRTNQVYLAHFAITDVASASHPVAERFARGHPRLAGVSADPFLAWLEDWTLEARGETWRLSAGTARHGAELTLVMDRPVVLQGEAGLSRKGPGQASYYYSVPGIRTHGELWLDGSPRQVSGLGWLDREWSTSVLGEAQLGWDWFALQLDDGRALVLYQLRRRDGSRDPYDQGRLILADGSSTPLPPEAFALTPVRRWVDPDGVAWPVAWRVRVGEEVWRVEAALDDQRMRTAVRYWEGLVHVYDQAGGRVGSGYLELTGYGGLTAGGERSDGQR